MKFRNFTIILHFLYFLYIEKCLRGVYSIYRKIEESSYFNLMLLKYENFCIEKWIYTLKYDGYQI